ncbi:MAG: thiamine phosphate synthase, partial [Hyphomicrobiales bacterium]|nr:thiamine phosphate synthase [Hyphomicrobiales bacterium]
SRDDAMEAGELGVDYVCFGEPDADGAPAPAARTLERAEWWADVFNVPCVAFAAEAADAEALARAGVEFVARGASLFADPRGARAAATETHDAIARAATPVA